MPMSLSNVETDASSLSPGSGAAAVRVQLGGSNSSVVEYLFSAEMSRFRVVVRTPMVGVTVPARALKSRNPREGLR